MSFNLRQKTKFGQQIFNLIEINDFQRYQIGANLGKDKRHLVFLIVRKQGIYEDFYIFFEVLKHLRGLKGLTIDYNRHTDSPYINIKSTTYYNW